MNLVYLIPALYNPGGMERILTDKINTLVSTGKHSISVVTTDQMGRTPFFELNPRVSLIHLDLDFNAAFELPMHQKYRVTRAKLRQYRQQLLQIIKETRTDICISTGGKELEFLSAMPVPCKKILEIHFAKNFREQFLLSRKNSLKNRLIGKIRTRQLMHQTKNLDAVVVLTQNDRKEWEKTHRNIHQIYNFASFRVDQPADLAAHRAIAVGRLDAQKGFDMLIDAWALKKEELKDWKLDIFGQGEWQQMLEEKISHYGLEHNVRLCGVTSDIKTEMLHSSLFLFSSRYEGFGLVLVEAMGCGLPLVSFDCPEGPAEFITNNDVGLLVPAGDIEKFAEAVVVLAENPQLRFQMGKKGYLKSDLFAKDKIMAQWTDLFDCLVQGNTNEDSTN